MSPAVGKPLVLLLANVMALIALAGPARAAPRQEVTVLVTDLDGKPQPGVVVFAADARSDAIAGMTSADGEGLARFTLASRRYNFGVLSPSLGVASLAERGPNGFTLAVRPLPAGTGSAGPEDATAQLRTPRAMIVRGRVQDELGEGLEGVRIEGVRTTGVVAGVALTGTGGRFALAFPGGAFTFRASAPGLKTVRLIRQKEEIVVVMGVAVEPQVVEIHAGHRLTFRLEDSIDPEYVPPPQVRAWLDYTYGICPSSAPLTAFEKRHMKKYWYLDVLRREPPNPATISSSSCTPPALVERQSSVVTDGFGPLDDGTGPPPPRAARDPAAGK